MEFLESTINDKETATHFPYNVKKKYNAFNNPCYSTSNDKNDNYDLHNDDNNDDDDEAHDQKNNYNRIFA